VDNHQAPPWYYLLELVKYSWPWLLFYPSGLVLVCKARSQPWAQLILVGTIGYLGTISIMTTKLPWYIMPLYPFVALTIGAQLGQIWQQKFSNHGAYYRLWSWLLALIAIAALGAGAYLSWTDHLPLLLPIGIILSGTSALAAWWIRQRDRRFIPALVAGLYVTLTLFVCSDVWLWELNEAYAVQPVAALVKSHTPPQATVFTTFAYHRPSLDFYSDRHVLPIAVSDLPAQWQPQRYLLIQAELAPQLTPLPHRVLAAADGWLLVSHNTINQSSP
jgi:4-amino-4-deoxy-L-arabinose transferase-like glycosyltransferase